ncbi:MAG: hypothetical protein M2R46_04000 [Verrucomicrobia subdivision 3 bacterium]|nr:hypothetical protein [Limisphaerales bacterium]
MNAAELYPIGGGECEVELDVPAGYPNDGTRPSNVPSGLYWDSDGICVYVWGPCDELEELYGDTVDGHNPAPPEDGDSNDGSPGTPESPDGDDPDDTPEEEEPEPEDPCPDRLEPRSGSYKRGDSWSTCVWAEYRSDPVTYYSEFWGRQITISRCVLKDGCPADEFDETLIAIELDQGLGRAEAGLVYTYCWKSALYTFGIESSACSIRFTQGKAQRALVPHDREEQAPGGLQCLPTGLHEQGFANFS